MEFTTANLSDAFDGVIQYVEPLFSDFGGQLSFAGPISTLKCFEDNGLVRKALESPGKGRVLVVDGGGSLRCAMLGDQLAALAVKNKWAGILINGCIRDSADIIGMDLGVKALSTHPRKSAKRNEGQVDIPVQFAGVTFTPGHHLYADGDGILVAPSALA